MIRPALLIAMLAIATVAHAQGSTQLTWTAPGDDGRVGRASIYLLKQATVRPDTTSSSAMDAWFAAATLVPNVPVPAVVGTTQSVTISGLASGTWYFVMMSGDEVPNFSPYSNVAVRTITDTVSPGRIDDLR